MAQLYFKYGAMGSSKTANALMARFNYEERGQETLMVTAADEDWDLTAVTHKVVGKVHTVRGQKEFGLDGALGIMKKLPRPIMMFLMWIFRTLDFFGHMPRALTDEDPNYATVFLSNLGSIQCPAVYHHLNNYGTNSIMVTIGTIHKENVIQPDGTCQVRDIVDVGVTLDERIADGFYFGRSWKIVQYMLSNPALLDRPLKEELDYVC